MIALQRATPFACTWLIEKEDRTPEVVLEASPTYWDRARGPRVAKVVFRNNLSPAEALERCCSGDGDVDIVTEVSPADAGKVLASKHAHLEVHDANRVLVGVFNRHPQHDAPLDDLALRRALNLAVDREKIVTQGLAGYASVIPALTPPWCAGYPKGLLPYAHDPAAAKASFAKVAWPKGRPLRIATATGFAGIANLLAEDIRAALGIAVEVHAGGMADALGGARALAEGKLAAPFDVLLNFWFDISSEAAPAMIHREFFGDDGAFRIGPQIPEFDRLYTELVRRTVATELTAQVEKIDRYVHDRALGLFLCSPKSLTAVNNHVRFEPYATTFELAEAEVVEGHWSLKR
ncbi:MAG: ABC transporter substrate-binding protein [Vulcanimicrobiaceae bacterium]